MCKGRTLWVIMILQLSLFASANAQRDTAVFFYATHFGEEEGLRQNTVNNFISDKNGFLWLATEGGLMRFTGNSFMPLKNVTGIDPRSLNRVKNVYLGNKDTIIAFGGSPRTIALIANNKVVQIEPFNLRKHGLFLWSEKKPMSAPAFLHSDAGKKEQLRWSFANGMLDGIVYSGDTFAVTLRKGIAFYNSKGLIKEYVIKDFSASRLAYSNKKVWYADPSGNLFTYTPAAPQLMGLLRVVSAESIALYHNRLGDGLFCIADSALFRLTLAANETISQQKVISNVQDASSVRTIYQRNANTIVMGTMTNGMFVYRKNIFTVSEPLTPKENNVFNAQLLLNNGNILTGRNKIFSGSVFIGIAPRPLAENYVSLKDHQGYIWYFSGKYLLRRKEIEQMPDTMFTTNVAGIVFEDRANRIWFSSSSAFGFFENEQFVSKKINGFAPADISCMQQTPQGSYFVGTKNKGVFSFESISSAPRLLSAFNGTEIRDIYAESNERIWLCTYGNGFFLLEKQKLTRFPDNDGLLSYVHYIIDNANGYFWLPSNNGLFLVSKASLLSYAKDNTTVPFFYRFSKRTGLRTNEFNGGAIPTHLVFNDGTVSLPSMDGLVQFNPKNVPEIFEAGPIVIERIETDSSVTDDSDKIKLGSDVKTIRIYVSASFWGPKENEMIEYRIIRTDNAGNPVWLHADASGVITLVALSHGSYTVELRKRIGLGENDFVYKNISLSISPKWYQTKAFTIAVYTITILILIVISLLRRRSYRRANLMLKNKIAAATSSLQQVNRDLEKTVSERTQEIQLTNYRLNERVKELSTLYRSGVILQNDELTADQTLKEIIDLLPEGFQYPVITKARIVAGDMEYSSTEYCKTPYMLRSDFTTSKGLSGYVEVCYTEEKAAEDEGPFFNEERKLLDMLANMLMVYFNKKEALAEGRILDAQRIEYTRSLEELLYITSHDVRRPVVNLLGLTALAAEPSMKQDDLLELFGLAKLSAKELDELTRKLTTVMHDLKKKHTKE